MIKRRYMSSLSLVRLLMAPLLIVLFSICIYVYLPTPVSILEIGALVLFAFFDLSLSMTQQLKRRTIMFFGLLSLSLSYLLNVFW